DRDRRARLQRTHREEEDRQARQDDQPVRKDGPVRPLAIVALLAGVAAAEPEAERLYKEGQAAYDAERYDEALAAWERSYELSHLPGLVFNIAQAHRFRGDCGKAVEAYKKFVALDPKSSERPTAEGFIKELSPCPADKPTPPPPPAKTVVAPAKPVTAD